MASIAQQIESENVLLQEECEKFYVKGVKASATRARKHALNISKLCKELRADITNTKNSM